MKIKTSITLSEELLQEIDAHVAGFKNRSDDRLPANPRCKNWPQQHSEWFVGIEAIAVHRRER